MGLTLRDVQGQRFVEGTPGQPLVRRVDNIATVIEACFDHAVRRVLLYPENLPEHFFDVSSGEAGAILQKLRTYHIRLAVVRTPALRLSRRFGELLADEQHGPCFRLLDDRLAAQEWLCLG